MELEGTDLAKSSFEFGIKVWVPGETLLDLWRRPKKAAEFDALIIPLYEQLPNPMARAGRQYRHALSEFDGCMSIIETQCVMLLMYDSGYCVWDRRPGGELKWRITEQGRQEYLASPRGTMSAMADKLGRRSERIFGRGLLP
jgi:hypothetical protein